MSFLKRILGSKEDAPEMVSKAEYLRLEERFNRARADAIAAEMAYDESRKAHRRVAELLTTARAEAAANAADAKLWRDARDKRKRRIKRVTVTASPA